MTEFKEKRRTPRIEVRIKVPGLGEVRNISADGMWLLAENPISVGTLLNLEFRPYPEGPLIKCKGEVIWFGHREIAGGGAEAGVKFVDLTESDRKRILEYVKSQYQH